jgi:hypothetical protein
LLLVLELVGLVLVFEFPMTLMLLIFIYIIQVTSSAQEDICLRATRVSTRKIKMD